MRQKKIYFGQQPLKINNLAVNGELVIRGDDIFYKISNYNKMPPFFMTVVSNSDHWMFVSSKGGLTCGRINPENALFPYYTDDKIHDASDNTGPQTIIIVNRDATYCLWEPFSIMCSSVYAIERNLYKNMAGNQLIFEEVNHDLQSVFSYTWMNSEKFGFIRKSWLQNLSENTPLEYEILDGLRNILPYGVNRSLQTNMSTLVDGYKKCELIENAGLGIYSLSSILTDRAEPSESLKATTVWQTGLHNPDILLSTDQLDDFRNGKPAKTEKDKKGKRGAFFVHSRFKSAAGQGKDWYIAAELNQDACGIIQLIHTLKYGNLFKLITDDVLSGTKKLIQKIELADGIQITSDKLTDLRHFTNTLFNCMRGGIFNNGYKVVRKDFLSFVTTINKTIFENNHHFQDHLPEIILYTELVKLVKEHGNTDLERITYEYLPLSFSRRHGDPSRPWNTFSIDIKKPDGSENLNYQGNWRDIFQNWEALAVSFPGFIESFIVKFLNASTIDGYNPYRVTREGFDWEIPDPDDPWSNIGYWGDHQVIYLLKFLELSNKYHPGKLQEFLKRDVFVYAHVPYTIKPYLDIKSDPRNSIVYDKKTEVALQKRIAKYGNDGKLYYNREGLMHKANITEKLVVMILAKLSNFVPGGGIWMNTQRPEWNDANNALAGYGLSMVTLYHMRRFITFITRLFDNSEEQQYLLSEEIYNFCNSQATIFKEHKHLLAKEIDDVHRKTILDALGKSGEKYRSEAYSGLSGKKVAISSVFLAGFFKLCLRYIDHTICVNKRSDGLYHSYNLIRFEPWGYSVEHLYEMLEGQVAVLNSGCLNAIEAVDLLDALYNSRMYRSDQHSYMLYPDKELPSFQVKNIIPSEKVLVIPFLRNEITQNNNRYIEKDIEGNYHFNGRFRNSKELFATLTSENNNSGPGKKEIDRICQLYSNTFNHHAFTGRSCSFYKYEGLGCIYWHMASKLLLAVGEICLKARHDKVPKETLNRLCSHYYKIKKGIGTHKNPDEYGAFPQDPYSHTPSFAGVQQPGMTGQVKEDIISRFNELGVVIEEGMITFSPVLLKNEDLLKNSAEKVITRSNEKYTITLNKNMLAFTFCGVPVIYKISGKEKIILEFADGISVKFDGKSLNKEISQQVFNRNPDIRHILVTMNPKTLIK